MSELFFSEKKNKKQTPKTTKQSWERFSDKENTFNWKHDLFVSIIFIFLSIFSAKENMTIKSKIPFKNKI